MKISKYQYGNPIEEWGSQWKNRLQPSARSKVLQKWNASGKKPKPESSNEYTERRIKEETKKPGEVMLLILLMELAKGYQLYIPTQQFLILELKQDKIF